MRVMWMAMPAVLAWGAGGEQGDSIKIVFVFRDGEMGVVVCAHQLGPLQLLRLIPRSRHDPCSGTACMASEAPRAQEPSVLQL